MLDHVRSQRHRPAERSIEAADLMAMPTRFGVYFVPFALASLQAVLRSHGLRASDLRSGHPGYQAFLRDLYLLAAQEKLGNSAVRTVQDFVRDLRRRDPRPPLQAESVR